MKKIERFGVPVLVVAAALLCGLSAGESLSARASFGPGEQIAIIPFRNETGLAGYDGYGDGCAFAVEGRLRSWNLSVVPLLSVRRASMAVGLSLDDVSDAKAAATVARAAGARVAVFGTVNRDNDKLFVETMAVDVDRKGYLLKKTFTAPEANPLPILDSIANDLGRTFTSGGRARGDLLAGMSAMMGSKGVFEAVSKVLYCWRHQKMEEAKRYAEEAIQANKEDGAGYLLKGAILLFSGLDPAAIGYLQTALEKNANGQEENLFMALARLNLEQDLAKARKNTDMCLRSIPDSVPCLKLGVVVALSSHDQPSARAFVSRGLSAMRDPDGELLALQSAVQLRDGDSAQAEKSALAALKNEPLNPLALQVKAAAELQKNDLPGAERDLRQALLVMGQSDLLMRREMFPIEENMGTAYFRMAEESRKAGKAEESRSRLAEAFSHWGRARDKALSLSEADAVLAAESLAAVEPQTLDKAAQEHDSMAAYRGLFLFRAGRKEEGRKALEDILARKPDCRVALEAMLRIDGGSEKGLALSRKLVELEPVNALVHAENVALLNRLGKSAEAAETGARFLASFPGTAGLRVAYANALAALGKAEDAAVQYRKAVVSDSKASEAYFGLGKVLSQSGKKEEAKRQLKKFMELAPSDHPLRAQAQGLLGGL